jgi:uncharacterized protein (UPF0548 family)|nr:DUF1990 family protein [Kofleriaceae bacterium]
MDILLFGQPELARWQARPFNVDAPRAGDHRDSYERDVATAPPGPPAAGGPHRRAAVAILRYDIFEPRLIRPVLAREPVAVGDAVGAHYVGFPVIRMFFASRVIETFDGDRDGDGWWRTGFTYRTLARHPELGEETFSVETELATGRVRVALRSWSRPGTRLTRALAPVLRRVQVGASHGALDHLAAAARGDR